MSDARALAAAVGLTSSSRMLFATSINFDVSAFEIFSALGAGACVEVVRDALELIERGGWTGSVISAVPSVLAELVDEVADGLDVETVICAGEVLTSSVVEKVRTALPRARVVNGYGQTESFYATAFALPPATPAGTGAMPIGRPLDNMRTYVLGHDLTPVPTGVV
ncbi:AMP-binding protein, partial [Streptomyces sp. WAC 04229]|uniref:AMP-binding protein n=2 Tax=unclassified Streptomyces TaxID=2593676 RepID=UPI003D71D384